MESPNVLLLDEPTNDLDIQTLTILEDYIEEFEGAVIIISHDRYLLDKIVEKVFVFEGNSKIVQYTGNYEYFKSLKQEQEIEEKTPKKEKERTSPRALKFTFNEQREWETIDDDIGELENKIENKDKEIEKSSTDYSKLEKLISEKEMLEKKLEEKMERWIYLSELEEQINSANN